MAEESKAAASRRAAGSGAGAGAGAEGATGESGTLSARLFNLITTASVPAWSPDDINDVKKLVNSEWRKQTGKSRFSTPTVREWHEWWPTFVKSCPADNKDVAQMINDGLAKLTTRGLSQHAASSSSSAHEALLAEARALAATCFRGTRWKKFPVYQPPENHPLARQLKACCVPFVGGQPNMLYHGLGLTEELTGGDRAVMDPTGGDGAVMHPTGKAVLLTESKIRKEIHAQHTRGGTRSLFAVMGRGGAGKTRAVFEALVEDFGLYICAAFHHQACEDFATCLSDLGYLDVDNSGVEATGTAAASSREHNSRSDLLVRSLLSSILARLLYLELFEEAKLKPAQFLLFQLAEDCRPAIVNVAKVLCNVPCNHLLTAIGKARPALADPRRILVVIDEAQVLLSQRMYNSFKRYSEINSKSSTGTVSAFTVASSVLFRVMDASHLVAVTCGTGFRLSLAEDELGSGGDLKAVPKFVCKIRGFKSYTDRDEVNELFKLWGLGGICSSKVLGLVTAELKSRPRFMAHFVAHLCTGTWWESGGVPETKGSDVDEVKTGSEPAEASSEDLNVMLAVTECVQDVQTKLANTFRHRVGLLKSRAGMSRAHDGSRFDAAAEALDELKSVVTTTAFATAERIVVVADPGAETSPKIDKQRRVIEDLVSYGVFRYIHDSEPGNEGVVSATASRVVKERKVTATADEPLVLMALMKAFQDVLDLDLASLVLGNWNRVRAISPSVNGFLFELLLCTELHGLLQDRPNLSSWPGLEGPLSAATVSEELRDTGLTSCRSNLAGFLGDTSQCTTQWCFPDNLDGPDLARVFKADLKECTAAPSGDRVRTRSPPMVLAPQARPEQAAAKKKIRRSAEHKTAIRARLARSFSEEDKARYTTAEMMLILVQAKFRMRHMNVGHALSTVTPTFMGSADRMAALFRRMKHLPVLSVVVAPLQNVNSCSGPTMAMASLGRGLDTTWIIDRKLLAWCRNNDPDFLARFHVEQLLAMYEAAVNAVDAARASASELAELEAAGCGAGGAGAGTGEEDVDMRSRAP